MRPKIRRIAMRSSPREGEVMAKVIEFYIPSHFRKQARWLPEECRGKVIEFRPEAKKSA